MREPGRPEEQRQRADEDAQCRQARQERRLLDKWVVHGRDGGGVVETSGRKDSHEACEDHDRRHGQPGGSDPAKLFPIPQPCFRCRRLRKDVPRDLVLLLDDRKPERVGREEQERQGGDRFLRQDRDQKEPAADREPGRTERLRPPVREAMPRREAGPVCEASCCVIRMSVVLRLITGVTWERFVTVTIV